MCFRVSIHVTSNVELYVGPSWVHFVSSGCGKTWAETRGERFVFTCKGCTEVKGLEKEVEGLKQMVE